MKIISLISLILVIQSCNITKKQSNSNHSAKILEVLSMQEDAWNHGNINGFMEGYWKSDSLKFVGSQGITYGWESTLKNYQKSYPNTKIMGKLHFEVDLIEKLSDDTYYLIGRYTLKRESDEPTGYFNLIWRKINGKWKVVTDMTCG